MYKIISNLLLLALFVSVSAVTASATNGPKEPVVEKSTCKIMQTLTVIQPNQGTASIAASWTATGNGPFLVTLGDMTAGVLVQQFTTNLKFAFFPGLTIGHTYNVSVGDVNVLGQNITLQ